MGSTPLGAQEHALAKLQAEQMDLSAIGVISGALSHELHNVLNNISLQVAVLKKQAPENFHASLTVIEEQNANAAAIVRSLQQYRQQHQSQLDWLDLNQLIRDELGSESQQGSLKLELAGDLPPVLGTRGEMKILFRWLIANARHLVPGSGNVFIQTSPHPYPPLASGEGRVGVRLQIIAQGRSLPPNFWQELFKPLGRGQEIIPRLELAGCQQIVQRFDGTLRGENLAAGGLAFVIELPKAEEATAN